MAFIPRAIPVTALLLVLLPLAAVAETPLDHLSQAERMLSAVLQDSLKKDEQKQLAELRKHFAELVNAYRINGDPFVPPAVTQPADVEPDAKSKPANWKESFSAVEKDLAGLLGGVPSLPPSDARRQLEQFRLELELFFASATLDLKNETSSPQSTPTE
jgi:hypothetical protein